MHIKNVSVELKRRKEAENLEVFVELKRKKQDCLQFSTLWWLFKIKINSFVLMAYRKLMAILFFSFDKNFQLVFSF
jgi:hypothetical protein